MSSLQKDRKASASSVNLSKVPFPQNEQSDRNFQIMQTIVDPRSFLPEFQLRTDDEIIKLQVSFHID